MSDVPETPYTPPTIEFGRVCDRVRNFIKRVRRAGVPHEETVIIPAVAIDLVFSIWKTEWPFWIPMIVIYVVYLLCGAWLALAWRRLHFFPMLLRPVYIGVLSGALWVLTHNEPYSNHLFLVWVYNTWFVFGSGFWFGYIMAGSTRDRAFGIFYSQKHRKIYLRKKERQRYFRTLVRDQDALKSASYKDFVIASLWRSIITDIKGLLALCGVVFSIAYYLIYGSHFPSIVH